MTVQRRSQIWLSGLVCCVCLLFAIPNSFGSVFLQDGETPKADESNFDLELFLKSYDEVVQTVTESHWDTSLIQEQFRPLAEQLREKAAGAKSAAEFRQVIEELLASLKQSHFGLIPNTSYEQMEAREKRGGTGYSGLTVRMVESDLMVTDVRPDSPAFNAGVRPGWKLISTEPADKVKILQQAEEVVATSTLRMETAAALVAQQYIGAPAGRQVKLHLEDLTGTTREIQFEMGPAVGRPSKFGNLPEVPVEFRSKLLDGNVGYMSFNAFLDAPRVMKEFTQAIDRYVRFVCGRAGGSGENANEGGGHEPAAQSPLSSV
jgi:carboxyl-terminal processing protease